MYADRVSAPERVAPVRVRQLSAPDGRRRKEAAENPPWVLEPEARLSQAEGRQRWRHLRLVAEPDTARSDQRTRTRPGDANEGTTSGVLISAPPDN